MRLSLCAANVLFVEVNKIGVNMCVESVTERKASQEAGIITEKTHSVF